MGFLWHKVGPTLGQESPRSLLLHGSYTTKISAGKLLVRDGDHLAVEDRLVYTKNTPPHNTDEGGVQGCISGIDLTELLTPVVNKAPGGCTPSNFKLVERS